MPTETWKRFTCYVAARLREMSTWQALIVVATAFGAQFSEDQKAAILSIGLGVAALLRAVFPDRIGSQQSRSTDQGETK